MSAPAEMPVISTQDGAVAVLRLNRSAKRNALDLTLRAALAAAVTQAAQDDAVRAIVLTGGDTVFAAGADLNLLVDKGAQQVANLDLGQYWVPLANCPKPIIAAVCGMALGAGCELAMMCDIIVAGDTAQFGQPELKVGIMPGAGGTQRLIRATGKNVASLMVLAGEPMKAERAYQLGLVAELVPAAAALPRALELAHRIAALPLRAVRAAKRVLAQGADLPLESALSLEHREFLLLFDTSDKTEGMRAFLEKRTPEFTGQ